MTPSVLLTTKEVAELLGVSSETILRWTRAGQMPAIRLPGGALRYSETAVEQWLTERATPLAQVVSAIPQDAARDRRYRGTLDAVSDPASEVN